MRVQIEHSDGHWRLYSPQGLWVNVPWWALLLWRLARRIDRFLDFRVFTPAHNEAFAKEFPR